MSSEEQLYRRYELPSGGVIAVAPISQLPAAHPFEEGLSEQRARERYSWRKVAREILADPAAQFDYNELGAPQIVGSDHYISVSHSSTLLAVVISPTRCAIDIERLDRNFERVASRYISPQEHAQLHTCELMPHIWSIKECLYKFAGQRGLDFIRDIRIMSIDGEEFHASLPAGEVSGSVVTIFGHVLAYVG